MNIKLAKDRVALTEIDEAVDGAIVIPQTRKVEFQLGKVIETGYNKLIKKGDVAVFQLPAQVKNSTLYKIKGQDGLVNDRFCVVHANDIIATLKTNIISLENFQISGNWILLEMFFGTEGEATTIVLPENYTPPIEEFRFRVIQIGTTADEDKDGNKEELMYSLGQEVYVERNRCNPIKIDNREFCFIEKSYIYGVAA